MIPFDEALTATLHKMGLAEPSLMADITREWGQLAGEPWASKATPLYLQSGVLVVGAKDQGGVSFLRYGVSELTRKLAERFGSDRVKGVEVRPPDRTTRRG